VTAKVLNHCDQLFDHSSWSLYMNSYNTVWRCAFSSICKTRRAATERLSIVIDWAKDQRRARQQKYIQATPFSLVLMWWRTRARVSGAVPYFWSLDTQKRT